jgi:hypothetical protein
MKEKLIILKYNSKERNIKALLIYNSNASFKDIYFNNLNSLINKDKRDLFNC